MIRLIKNTVEKIYFYCPRGVIFPGLYPAAVYKEENEGRNCSSGLFFTEVDIYVQKIYKYVQIKMYRNELLHRVAY